MNEKISPTSLIALVAIFIGLFFVIDLLPCSVRKHSRYCEEPTWYANLQNQRAESKEGNESRPQERTFAWRFSTKDAEGELPPRTQVALITNGEVYDLGEYAGSCAEITGDRLIEGEVAAVLCWWAGRGDEIGIFRAGEGYQVKLGIQEESTAESDGFRGDFRDYFTLD